MYSGFHTNIILFQAKVDAGNDGVKYITVTRVGPENPQPKQLDYIGSEYQLRFPLRPDIKSLEQMHLDIPYAEQQHLRALRVHPSTIEGSKDAMEKVIPTGTVASLIKYARKWWKNEKQQRVP